MSTEIVERAGGASSMAPREEPTSIVLQALLQAGYRTSKPQDETGDAMLLLHPGKGADIVLYPDGSLQTLGGNAQPAFAVAQSSGLRVALDANRLTMWLKLTTFLAAGMIICFVSLGIWLTILENF